MYMFAFKPFDSFRTEYIMIIHMHIYIKKSKSGAKHKVSSVAHYLSLFCFNNLKERNLHEGSVPCR